jgi:hypothetical protein
MNRIIATALIAFAASSTFAESPIGDASPFVSAVSRTQVQSEQAQYAASGVNHWAQNFDQLAGFRSVKTRAQVSAEYVQSRDETAALTAEDSGSAWLSARARDAAAPVFAGQPVRAQ